MSKHTPGPWEVAYYDKNGQAVVKSEHIEIATCWHHCVGAIEKQMKANARLMAAAPDLLAALVVLVEEKVDYMRLNNLGDPEREYATKQARAAIAKATGEQA